MQRKSRLTLVMMAILLMVGMVGIQPAKPVKAANPLRISQAFGGGGSVGSPYTHDFFEIYNSGSSPVSLAGMSIQYASATGAGNFGATATQRTELPNVLLGPGQYYLIQEAGGTNGSPLPTPDLIDATAIAVSATGGKVALVNSQVSLGCNGGSAPCGPEQLALIIDLVGFGDANFYEGTAATPAPSNSTSVIRKEGGCTDTDQNGADFEALTPVARNTASPAHACGPVAPLSPVINEFSASTTGDDVEFVEIFGSPNTDYSAYTILEIEGDGNASNSSEGFVDEVIALGTTDANGFLLVSLLNGALENGTISLLLVKDNTATLGVDIDTDDNGVIDATYWSEITDGVAVNDGGTADLTYATPTLGVAYDGLGFAPGGASRIPDGTDTDTTADWVRNDFDLAGIPGFPGTIRTGEAYNTPGAANQVYVETAPSVVSTIPTNGANHPIDENITITFSELVNVTDPWFSISCGTSGAHTAVVNATDPVYTLNPDVDFTVGESCTITITAANVVDDDTDDTTYNAMLADYTFSFTAVTPLERCGDPYTSIYAIQGTGETSPLAGTALATEGVVVGDFQVGGKNGYYIQDVTGDGNTATSDGIFVYNTTTAVNVGDRVRVRGTAVEFSGITEISPVTKVWICSTGNTVAPTPVTLPVSAVNDFEKYESMLVTFTQSLIVSEYFNFDRYGEIVLTATRHMTPTAFVEPGPDSVAAAQAYLLDRITLDDGRTSQNLDPAIHPNGLTFNMTNLFRGGATVTNATGILDFYQSLYRLQPTTGAVYQDTNPRTTAPDITESDLKVTSYNVLNYFVTLDDDPVTDPNPTDDPTDSCGPNGGMDCRGADDAEEFGRQKAKILSALVAINADVFGLMEIENDSSISGNDAVANLVAGLNAITGEGTYAYIDTGAIGGDAIKQAILYKPASVTPVGEYKILDSSIDTRFIDDANRPVLAQVFVDNETGVEFVVAVNHLKSKGSACAGDPDLGDGAGNCNLTRKAAAQALVDWLSNPTYFPDAEKALIIGDLNSYDKEDPIDMIRLGADDTADTADDFKDMIFEKRGELAYGYVFDGQTGYLDHALASQALAENIVDVNFWHINADEPDLIDYDTSFKLPAQDALYAPDAYRSSDHDPVIVTLSFKGDFFVTQDFGPWGAGWVGAYNLGWKYNDPFDINTIASIEVGMLDAAGNLIVNYTADAEQVAWQIANGYITPGGQESAPFYQEVDGTPIAEGRGEDWTVGFGPSFAAWNPALGYVKVINLNGTVDYKTVAYTGTGDVYSDIFETQDFGLWGPSWPAAFNLGWKYNDSFDIQTIKLVEVGMIDASGNIIVRYTADLEQVAWQIANGYITPGGQESAPFYREYNGTPIAEGRDDDWTVIFGPSFDSWNPTWAFVKVESLDGQMEYKLVPYLGAPALADDFFVTQDFGPWGAGWVGAYNLGWKYNDSFDINTIASVEVGMLDAAGNLIVNYTADAEQVAWQIANSYITPGGQESAPFYQEVDGTPIAEGRGEDWTVGFGPSFAAWNPALGYVKVINLNGTVDYKTVAYTGTGDVYSDIFETQDFGLWGPSWPAAFNLGWKYNDSFDIETIKLVEVGMIDASGNIIVRYTADLEQVAWQIANSYITPGGQESAPFYQEYNGTPIAEGRDDDWTVIFGPSFDSWNPTWAFVKVESLDGQMEYKLVPYLGVPALVDDMFEITDFGLWGAGWPGAFNLGWGYTPEFDTDTIAAIEVGMLDANGDLIVRYTAEGDQLIFQKDNGYITDAKLSSAPFYHYVAEGPDLDWTVILGPAFDAWAPALGYVRVVNTNGSIDYDEIGYTGTLPAEPPFLNVTGVDDGETALIGDMENGYLLQIGNDPLVDHELQFAAGTAATKPLADDYFGLTLISSTVTPEALKAYYDARGVPAPYLQYLKDAADGLNPFVYIKGLDVTLVDAAKHDLGAGDFGMTIPDDFPVGTYVVRGPIFDAEGNGTLVTLTLTILSEFVVTDADLEASSIIAGPYTALPGTLADGFTMVLDPAVEWYYFDTDTITSSRPLADGSYPFYLEGTTTEIFTLVVNGTDYFLRDTYKNDGTPLRVQGNFPLGTYTYVGEVEDEFGFTDEISLTIMFVAPLEVTDADLKFSMAPTGPYTALDGTYADGFMMYLDPSVSWYYLDADMIEANNPLADGSYPFYLAPDTTTPIFYVKVAGTTYTLIDAYQGDPNPLRINGDFVPGTYTYTGSLTDIYGSNAPVSIEITFVDALTWLQANTVLSSVSGTIADLKATFPAEIPAVIVAEPYIIDSRMTLAAELPAGSTVTIYREGVAVLTDITLSGTGPFWFTELFDPGPAPRAPFDAGYGGAIENYVIEVTGPGNNPLDFDTTVLIESVISKDGFATETVLDDITLGVHIPAVEIAALEWLQANTVLSSVSMMVEDLTATFPLSIPPVIVAEDYVIDSRMTLAEALPAGSTVTVYKGGVAVLTDITLSGTGPFWFTELFDPGPAPRAAFDANYGGKVEEYSIVVTGPGNNPLDFDTTVLIESVISKDGFGTETVLDDITLGAHIDDAVAPTIETGVAKSSSHGDVALVDGAFTVNQGYVVDTIEITLDEDVLVDLGTIVSMAGFGPYGTVTANVDGVITITPYPGYETAALIGTFTFTVPDGSITDLRGNEFTGNIILDVLNVAPVAMDDAYTTDEDVALSVPARGVLVNDTDFDPSVLTAIIVTEPVNGTLVLNADGSFTYTPDADFYGTDTFTYKANDGHDDSNTATVTITVTDLKDQVQAVDDEYTTDEDTALTVEAPGVLANDIDVDGNEQAASLVTDVQHGTLSLLGDGSFTYTPDPDFFGIDTFVYKLITYPAPQNLWTDEATVTITVNPIGDAPVLGMIEDATIPELVEFSFTATATDVDLPAQVLTFSLVGAPEGAAITAGGVFTWTPSELQGPGEFTFTVMVCDDTAPTALCDEQEVTLTVTEVNTAPVAQDLTETTEEDTPVDITLVATDAQNDPLIYSIIDQPMNGEVTLVDDVATYTPDPDFNGEDSFTYKANDGLVDSEMAVVSITVTPVNDAPMAVGEIYSTDEDITLTVLVEDGVLANDTDVDGDTLSAVLVNNVVNGTLDLANDGSFVYTPAENFYGLDSFTYKASDGTLESWTVTVTIVINPVNDWVVANDDEYETMAGVTLEVAAPGVLTNDELLDPSETVTVDVLVQPAGGTLTLNDDGSFTYVPNAGFFGVDTFEYQLNSMVMLNGEFSDTAVVTIKVTANQIFLPIILR